jgi:hypothetical protein
MKRAVLAAVLVAALGIVMADAQQVADSRREKGNGVNVRRSLTAFWVVIGRASTGRDPLGHCIDQAVSK